MVRQSASEGLNPLGWVLVFTAMGIVLYFPFQRFLKTGVLDVDPYREEEEEA